MEVDSVDQTQIEEWSFLLSVIQSCERTCCNRCVQEFGKHVEKQLGVDALATSW
jgi:hypothetical protein